MRKPFLTPPTLPETGQCRSLQIPSDKYWLGIFNSALLEMTHYWNYEQVNETDLTVDETIAVVETIIAGYFENTCGATLPEGQPILRLGEFGETEQLGDGEWVEPTGDYAVPPVPARTEPTSEERRCLASKNAVNALHEMYEQTSDAWSAGSTEIETLLVMAGALTVIILPPIGLAAAALYAAAGVAFHEAFLLFNWLTADLWNDDFTELLECVFYNCSTDTAGVVTFDFECLQERINAELVYSFDLTLGQQRLALQLGYLMGYIGADGLNHAGTTTAITTGDCLPCQADWALYLDCALFQGSFTVFGGLPNWNGGAKYIPWSGFASGVNNRPGESDTLNGVSIGRLFPACEITRIRMYMNQEKLTNVPPFAMNTSIQYEAGSSQPNLAADAGSVNGFLEFVGSHVIPAFGQNLYFQAPNQYRNDGTPAGGSSLIRGILIQGNGTTPDFGTGWVEREPI